MLDFCCFVGIYKDYISEHNIGDGSELDFSEPIKLLRTEAENSLEYWTLAGKTNPAMAIFSLKNNFGWVDRKEIGGANGGAIQQEFRVIMPEVASPHLLEEAAEDEEIQDLPTVP